MVVENHSNSDLNNCESHALEYSVFGSADSENREISSSVDVAENGKIARQQ